MCSKIWSTFHIGELYSFHSAFHADQEQEQSIPGRKEHLSGLQQRRQPRTTTPRLLEAVTRYRLFGLQTEQQQLFARLVRTK